MLTDVTHVSVLVDDQDEALEFYRDTLGLVVRDDETMEMEGMEGRWLTVRRPRASSLGSRLPWRTAPRRANGSARRSPIR